MIPAQKQQALRAQYNPDGSALRAGQLRMVEMLVFLDRICRKHGLTYWLDSGTLLGAKRHGGFIPWDDDTDVCMPIRDVRKLERIMRKQHPSDEFVIQCRRTDKGYFGAWYVLRDLRSEYEQDSLLHQRREYRGVQVDIFPMESGAVPCLHRLAELWQRCWVDHPMDRIRSGFLARCVVVPSYYVLHWLVIPLLRLFGRRKDRFSPVYGVLYSWTNIPKSWVLPLGRASFEGHEFAVPGNAEAYLKESYGDWEALPETIRTHQVKIHFKEKE